MTPLDQLQTDIQAELERDPKGPRVAQLLKEYSLQEDDWRPFALFDASGYARNLVHRSELYEMIVVCWGMWQESPIHCHAGQHCWMSILEGDIEETHYDFPAGEGTPLVEGRKVVFQQGSVAYINDEIALHRVRPAAGLTGVSLHLYANPIEVCNVYDPSTGCVVPRKLGYHSIEGSLTT